MAQSTAMNETYEKRGERLRMSEGSIQAANMRTDVEP